MHKCSISFLWKETVSHSFLFSFGESIPLLIILRLLDLHKNRSIEALSLVTNWKPANSKTQSYSQDQYKFIYDTLEEYCRGIDSRFPVSELANKIKEKTVKDQKLKKNAYALEYAVRGNFCLLKPLTFSPSIVSEHTEQSHTTKFLVWHLVHCTAFWTQLKPPGKVQINHS